MHLNPTQVAIQVFGSPLRLTRAIGAPKSAPFRWLAPRLERGEQGDIPVAQIRKILTAARERALELSERDLLYGREVADAAPASEPVAAG
jgi:hypothetical protein